MKKLIACFLTLAMLVGIVPAALAANNTETTTGSESVKVLLIGDQSARFGMEYLYKILEAEGYTDICLASVYQAGITLDEYATGATATTPATYRFNRNIRDFWGDIATGVSLESAVTWEAWDYIVLQTTVDSAEDAASMTSAVNTLVPLIKKLNSTAQIGLHVDWAKEGNMASFDKIAAAAQKTILDSSRIDFALPVGTAIMNVQTSFLDTIYKDFETWKTDENGNRVGDQPDNANLNALGQLVAGYAWYAMLCDAKLTELKFVEADMVTLSSAERKAIVEAVNNAIKNPFKVTTSSYATEPAQYTAVINGAPGVYMPGDTITVTAKANLNAGRKFLNWSVVKGGVKLANASATTTTFKMPAQDVEVKPVYEAGKDVVFQAGFGRADVTPDQPINLAGGFDTGSRVTDLTHPAYPEDRLTMSAIALSDGDYTHIVMTTDFIRVPTLWHKKAEAAVYEKYGQQYGLNEFCLSISATHTHSAPDIGDGEVGVKQGDKQVNSFENGKNYWYFRDFWLPGIVEAAGKALEDLAPVQEARVNSINVPNATYVRHYRKSTNKISGVNFGDSGDSKGYFRAGDEEMQVVNFVRNNADDIVLVNFQAHATGGSDGAWDKSGKVNVKGTEQNISYLYITPDFPGFTYRYIQDNYKDDEGRSVSAAYFQGACGNMNAQCLMGSVRELYGIDKAERNKWGRAQTTFIPDNFGWYLGEYAVTALENMKTVETGEVKAMRQQFIALEYLYDKTREIQQDVVAVGPSIAFITAGYEMFDTHGRQIKDNSPYEVTFIIENAQGHEYMPDWQTWNYPVAGGVEAYEANYSKGCVNVAKGTGDDLADGVVGLLNVLYEEE